MFDLGNPGLGIHDKPFDQLVFVEKDRGRSDLLEQLRTEYPKRDILISGVG